VEDGTPLDWFEPLYQAAERGSAVVPWADMAVNPHLASWPGLTELRPGRALVVGCGYGDDAEWLAARGWAVTAFDISRTAIDACARRFPGTTVDYRVADLLATPPDWQPFDLVFEAYTVQVLPPHSDERSRAIASLQALTGDSLLVVARGRSREDSEGQMPWPLTLEELEAFAGNGLTATHVEDFADEDPPVRRFRALFTRR
jgi:SAM-dependent methyltransferase